MPRIRLIHWNPAEAAERATRLPDDEFDVDHAPLDPTGLRALRANPPDALLIDLSRLPSHGRDVGVSMRQTRATRGIPLVFVDGAPEKVEPIRQLLPDAVYTDWPNIQPALRHASANPPSQPVVLKSSLAGYSGTPLPRKLGIKPGDAVALPGAPDDFETTLANSPTRSSSAAASRAAATSSSGSSAPVASFASACSATAPGLAPAVSGSAGPRKPPASRPTYPNPSSAKPASPTASSTTKSPPSTKPGLASASPAASPANLSASAQPANQSSLPGDTRPGNSLKASIASPRQEPRSES